MLRFDSPTIFRSQHGFVIPFPLPALVFGSLIDRWNTFSEIRLHPDVRRLAEAGIEVRQHRTHTEPVSLSFGESRLRGRVFGILPLFDPAGRSLLAGYDPRPVGIAFYAGVGAHTTMGLGRVHVHRPTPSWEITSR